MADIIVIGSSAGGIEALKVLVHGLSSELPAAVFVVQHLSRESPFLLPAIWGGQGRSVVLFPER